MNILKFIDRALNIVLLILGINVIIETKESEGKKIEDIRPSLTNKINILMILTVLVAVTTISIIVLNIK